MDFAGWSDAALQRYSRAFRLDARYKGQLASAAAQPRPRAMVSKEREQLVSQVAGHFSQQRINEQEVVADFLFSMQHRGQKLWLPPHMLDSPLTSAAAIAYSPRTVPRTAATPSS
ncbi:hypothetical protein HK105_208427 [Polyrhizophydium stewartii]|uniref:Histone deacetylase complex subunit SAP30 Sin3 binding domain-containing protein n=1 Tax=Polyrhizophydium stewartii TaxID=2732419 RepID=A0ABR4MXR9_9FUNG